MKERVSRVGGMLEKTGIPDEVKVLFPENLEEIPEFLGKKKVGKYEQDISVADFLSYSWRGYTLSFQREGEQLTEDERIERKATRKADNTEIREIRKLAKEAGVSLAEFLKSLR